METELIALTGVLVIGIGMLLKVGTHASNRWVSKKKTERNKL